MTSEPALQATMPVEQSIGIALQPLSHPELGEIRIEDSLFAIGRTEPPFDAFAADAVSDLSRRHARIFCEVGAVYVADLDSKNGTTVNGISARQKIVRLEDGDELCFGGKLCYRVRIGRRLPVRERRARLVSLSLLPEQRELGLQPIVVTQFPFLISKSDDIFARYRDSQPQQVNYLSRRHAHIFVKNGVPYVEDLGSTNGSFVDGRRLDEHAVALHDGAVLAFGGHHFVYRVSIDTEELEFDPTVTKLAGMPRKPLDAGFDADKTTFVTSAGSFLDIFCVDRGKRQEDEINAEAQQTAGDEQSGPGKASPRGKFAYLWSELRTVFGSGESNRRRRWVIPAAAGVMLVAGAAYLMRAPVGEVQDLLAAGDFAQAATLAENSLARDPDNVKLRALGTEAVLRHGVPTWLNQLGARDFDGADATLERMQQLARNNQEMQPLLEELRWVGSLERTIAARGGADKPPQDAADERRVKQVLSDWQAGTQRHQVAFSTISQHVPEFRERYASSVSQLRKLELAAGRREGQP